MSTGDLEVIVTMWNAGMTSRDIAAALGMEPARASNAVQRARQLGLGPERRQGTSERPVRERVWELLQQGMAPSEIDEALGITGSAAVVSQLWRRGWGS